MSDQKLLHEKKLVESLVTGDFEAFDQLFGFYNHRLYYFAKSIIKNREDAQDIVQEVFLRVWKNREKINQSLNFKSFLFTISYNIIVDNLRQRMSKQSFRDYLIKNAIPGESSVENKLEFEELNSLYKNTIEALPPKRKEIYKLHRFEQLSYTEIAKKLNISVNTVRNQMAKSLSYLRSKIGRETLLCLLFISLFV